MESISRLEHLIRSLPQIVIYLDENGRVIRHNRNLVEILSTGIDDIAGEPLRSHLHPWAEVDAAELDRLLTLPLGENEDLRMKYAISLKTNWSSRGIFRAALQAFDDGDSVEYLLLLEDVTGLRQMEEEYRRVQRIQGLLPLIRGFGSDFKDRLTVIFGNIEYVIELIKGGPDDILSRRGQLKDNLVSAMKQLERSNGRLDNILWLSEGGIKNLGEFSLNDAIREVGEQVLLGSNKTLEILEENDIPPYQGDYEKIIQLLQNILVNAVQAGTEAYTITVSLELVNRDARDCALISISDHGRGMSVDVLARAQQPFFSTRDDVDGLGLFIAKNIALEHNGSLELESTPGKGSKVHIYLPLYGSEITPQGERSIPEGLKLLILDDNQEIQDVWERLLYQLGIQGSFVGSTAQAFEKFERALDSDYPFNIVVLEDNDSDIPDVFQLIERFHKLSPGLPAVYSSGRNRGLGTDELLSRGFHAYLRKPFRIFDVQDALIKALYHDGKR